MVKNNYVLGDSGSGTVLISGYVIGKDIPPGVMWIVGNIPFGVLDDAGGPNRTDVMAFTVIVPGNDLGVMISVLLKDMLQGKGKGKRKREKGKGRKEQGKSKPRQTPVAGQPLASNG